jgi:hypothetical protein
MVAAVSSQPSFSFSGPPEKRPKVEQMSGKPSGHSLNDAMEAYFRERPNRWISFHELAKVGGTGGWRTRISDIRRKRGMVIANEWHDNADGFRESFYMYVPAGTQTESAA